MKTKLIFSKYEESTGVSISVIRCRYGEFTGIARLNPEDRANASSFVGCEIAERRAVIKALRTQLREVKAMQKAVEMIIEELEKSKTYQKHSVENRRLRKSYWLYQKQILDIKKNISDIEESINTKLSERATILKRFSKYDNNIKRFFIYIIPIRRRDAFALLIL